MNAAVAVVGDIEGAVEGDDRGDGAGKANSVLRSVSSKRIDGGCDAVAAGSGGGGIVGKGSKQLDGLRGLEVCQERRRLGLLLRLWQRWKQRQRQRRCWRRP